MDHNTTIRRYVYIQSKILPGRSHMDSYNVYHKKWLLESLNTTVIKTDFSQDIHII